METSYEMIYKGLSEVDFIIDDLEVNKEIDDLEQHNVLLANGTLCYSCGDLNESLIGDDRILKPAKGKPYLCGKCKGEWKNEQSNIIR